MSNKCFRGSMGIFEYMTPLWKIKQGDNMRYLLFVENWNYQQRPRVQRVSRPKRPEKATELGYKPQEGYFIYHVQVRRGGRRKSRPLTGDSTGPKAHQQMAETKANRHVKTLKVIDSYWVSQDGTYKYYEVLMVDPSNDNVMRDYNVKDILARRRRERAEVAGRMINNNLSPPRGRFGGRGGGFPYRVGYQGGYPGAGPSSR
ncbi:large ribosomal subunit protein eL15-like [Symsagittifera roscoffensis]|uniref:large ribosomal subunit protein eL15-like n=1 Tax=Symsagittifera roscoffensis TaxID=84072 RepID=UPI00307C7BA5